MLQIINTRPAQRAGGLTSQLSQAGFEVVELPLLVLKSLEVDESLKNQFQQFQQADCVVVVSPTAAELGLKTYFDLGYTQSDLLKKIWIAVGQATQQYLAQFNIPSVVPEVETSEGMLALPIFNSCHGQRIAFWRGIGGRTFMMEQLQRQDCTIINMLLYKRELPESSWDQAKAIAKNAIVLMSSEESWNNWRELGQYYQWELAQYHYIVLGDRVTQVLQQYFVHQTTSVRIDTVYTLNIDAILAPIQQRFLK